MGMRVDGSTTYSRDGSPVFGSFFGESSLSQHAIAYADNCVVVDKSVDLTRVAPYGCGFQTGAGTVLNVLDPAPEDSLVVFGVGRRRPRGPGRGRDTSASARSSPSTR